VAQLYPRTLGSIFVSSYGSQGLRWKYSNPPAHGYLTAHSQLAGPSWCQAPIWDTRAIFLSPWNFLCTVVSFLFWSGISEESTACSLLLLLVLAVPLGYALSDERSELSFVSLLTVSVYSQTVCAKDNYIICVRHSSGVYIRYIQGLFQSRLGTADYALVTSSCLYYGSLDTLTEVHMTAAKFKPLILSMSVFTLSNIAIIFIFMILDDFCLLPAWFCYVMINVRNLESLMHIANRCQLPMVRRTLFCSRCDFNRWHSASNSQTGQA
jgi:hypothetical protein